MAALFLTLLTGLAVGAAGAWHWTRRRFSRRHRRETAEVSALLGSVEDGLIVTDMRGDLLGLNEAAARSLGMKEEELAPSTGGLLTPKDPDQWRFKLQGILKSHTHAEAFEVAGPPAKYFKTSVKMLELDGEPGVAMMLSDITEEKTLAAVKEEFFSSIAHDIRAPLFALQGYFNLLEGSLKPDDEQRKYFNAISECCEKLTMFMEDSLDSARLAAEHFKPSWTRVDARAIVEKAVAPFAPLAKEKGIALELKFAPKHHEALEADERLLERVLYNLLSNAVKFTPQGGRIIVEVEDSGAENIEFSVEDTGPGVAPQDRGLIFERYRPLKADRAKRGFGFGLPLCRKIVKLHGGEIWVESEPGKGSQFIFHLPLKQRAEEKT